MKVKKLFKTLCVVSPLFLAACGIGGTIDSGNVDSDHPADLRLDLDFMTTDNPERIVITVSVEKGFDQDLILTEGQQFRYHSNYQNLELDAGQLMPQMQEKAHKHIVTVDWGNFAEKHAVSYTDQSGNRAYLEFRLPKPARFEDEISLTDINAGSALVARLDQRAIGEDPYIGIFIFAELNPVPENAFFATGAIEYQGDLVYTGDTVFVEDRGPGLAIFATTLSYYLDINSNEFAGVEATMIEYVYESIRLVD